MVKGTYNDHLFKGCTFAISRYRSNRTVFVFSCMCRALNAEKKRTHVAEGADKVKIRVKQTVETVR